jgi:pyochelin biosynthetic protein PchC
MTVWFRRLSPSGRTRLRLVCLPNAGSGASMYHAWLPHLPGGTEVLAVSYPGRQERFAEPPVDNMASLVSQLVVALEPELDLPLAIFGHSVGASIGHELALWLENKVGSVPVLLCVSGGRAPGRGRVPQLADVTEAELIAEIERLGGVEQATLADPELRGLLLPMMWADYRLRANYQPSRRTVGCPLVAYVGDSDADCTLEENLMWATATRDLFDSRVFAGDHFYLVPQRLPLLADLGVRLAAHGW